MRILFYIDEEWAFGLIHKELIKHFILAGHDCDTFDWAKCRDASELYAVCHNYDRVVTILGVEHMLVNSGVPKNKIIVCAHAKCDIDAYLKYGGPVSEFCRFIAVSPFVKEYAETHLKASPVTLQIGVSRGRYTQKTPTTLRAVGYASVMSRVNHQGVEIKRGHLAAEICSKTGLQLEVAQKCTVLAIPYFWSRVDACLVTSLEEGAGMPMLEAAASGRLVITTPVGHATYLNAIGAVTMIEALEKPEDVVAQMVDHLQFFARHPLAFYHKCLKAREAMAALDWKRLAPGWIDTITKDS